MKEKGLFFWKESVVNGKSYWQLWYRGLPDRFVCSENKLVKVLEASGLVIVQTKKEPEIPTKIEEGREDVSD